MVFLFFFSPGLWNWWVVLHSCGLESDGTLTYTTWWYTMEDLRGIFFFLKKKLSKVSNRQFHEIKSDLWRHFSTACMNDPWLPSCLFILDHWILLSDCTPFLKSSALPPFLIWADFGALLWCLTGLQPTYKLDYLFFLTPLITLRFFSRLSFIMNLFFFFLV